MISSNKFVFLIDYVNFKLKKNYYKVRRNSLALERNKFYQQRLNIVDIYEILYLTFEIEKRLLNVIERLLLQAF